MEKDNLEIIFTIRIKIPLWDAIKLRIAGRGADALAKELAERIREANYASPETE